MEDKQRLKELADRSYIQGQYTFTDFMSLAEQSVYYECERELSYAHPTLYGGCDMAERKMIRFGSEEDLGIYLLRAMKPAFSARTVLPDSFRKT